MMEQLVLPTNPPYLECCVCGLRGQKAAFTPISDILPIEEGNTSQTIITALGVKTSSPENLICEACHLKIFNFKRFALESHKTKQFLRQYGHVPATQVENLGTYSTQSVQGPQPMYLRNNSEIGIRHSVGPRICHSPNTYTSWRPSNTYISTTDSQGTSNESPNQIIATTPISQVHTTTTPISQVHPAYISNTTSSAHMTNPYQAPISLPTGTVMLKKEKSSVYILPDGTTIEVLSQLRGANQLNYSEIQPTATRLPVTSSLSSQSILPQRAVHDAVDQSRAAAAIPGQSSIDVNVARMDLCDAAVAKPTVIFTDNVQVPTLLLPKGLLQNKINNQHSATGPKPFTPSAPVPPSIPVNSNGKVAIPRIQRAKRHHCPPMLLPKVAAVPKLRCPKCSMLFLTEVDLTNHLSTHPEVLTCRVCQAPALSKEELLTHVRAAHKEMLCSVEHCNFVSTSPQLLKKHILEHSLKKKYQCTLCGKSFKNATYLRLHKKRHATDRETFKCQVCNKLFKSKISLRCHVRFHELGFNKCPKCDKKFQFKESLRRHQAAMHSVTAPFCCEICNQRCADKQSKLYHLKTHNKEQHKTVSCPVTGCKFKGFYEYRIKRHLKTAHKDYTGHLTESTTQKCPFCEEAVSSVNVHLKDGECRLQLQTLVQEIVSSTYEGHMSSTEQRQEAAATVLKEYRTRLGASQSRKQLDSLTQEGNNEFIEALMGTISKLRERLGSTEQPGSIEQGGVEEHHSKGTGFKSQHSGIRQKRTEQKGDIHTFSEDVDGMEVTLESPTSNIEGKGTDTVDNTADMSVQPTLDSFPQEEFLCSVSPPGIIDRQLETHVEQEVPPGGSETYQEVIVEGEQISEDMIKLVESALQSGALKSGTSFIIVNEST